MRPLSPSAINKLRLRDAAVAEVKAVRNLLPPEPDWSTVRDFAGTIERMARSRLGSGMVVRKPAEVSARKSRHGLRPLPFLGLVERVVYAALTDAVTKEIQLTGRGSEGWLEVSRAPAEYGRELSPKVEESSRGVVRFGDLPPWNSPVKYVVKSDVVAFYRHVNHKILRNELIIQGSDYELTDHLIEFLGELYGHHVGLPQLHQSSDALSEVYIDAVERNMLRLGYAVWRFNDDFRVAVKGFMEALRALEDLDGSLREIGLTLNEVKTTIPTFATYYLEVMGLEVSATGSVVPRQEVEDVVGDYTDDFTQDADRAARFLDRVTDKPDGSLGELDVKDFGPSEVRLARRALAGLARARDARGLDKLALLVRYCAELTPAAIKYVLTLRVGRRASRSKLAEGLRSEEHTS